MIQKPQPLPLQLSTTTSPTDGDRDGDGYPDEEDAFPDDPQSGRIMMVMVLETIRTWMMIMMESTI